MCRLTWQTAPIAHMHRHCRPILLLIGIRWSPEHRCNFLVTISPSRLSLWDSANGATPRNVFSSVSLLRFHRGCILNPRDPTREFLRVSLTFLEISLACKVRCTFKCVAKKKKGDEEGGAGQRGWQGANYRSRHGAKGRNRWAKGDGQKRIYDYPVILSARATTSPGANVTDHSPIFAGYSRNSRQRNNCVLGKYDYRKLTMNIYILFKYCWYNTYRFQNNRYIVLILKYV